MKNERFDTGEYAYAQAGASMVSVWEVRKGNGAEEESRRHTGQRDQAPRKREQGGPWRRSNWRQWTMDV